MRYFRYAFLLVLAIVLVTVAFANRELVTVRLVPDDLAGVLTVGSSGTMPLFLVIFIAIVVGVALGFVWEWLREHQHRAAAVRERREKEQLKREVGRLRGGGGREDDEVLRLLDDAGAGR